MYLLRIKNKISVTYIHAIAIDDDSSCVIFDRDSDSVDLGGMLQVRAM